MSQKSPILKSTVKSLPFNWYFKETHFKKELKKIIEKNKKIHYSRITDHMKNYNILYRNDSSYLLDEIVKHS